MKRTWFFSYTTLIVVLAVELGILSGCKKDNAPRITTYDVSNITAGTAVSGGNITSDGGHVITERGVCWNIYSQPTIDASKTVDSSGTGSFTSTIKGLMALNTYHLRAYATNSEGTVYGNEVTFSTPPVAANQVQDMDGNVYNTIKIGTQIWMKENLKTTRYASGAIIPNVTDPTAWRNSYNIGAYCDYDNNPANASVYGRLYNYYACVKVGDNICPTGWYVPSDGDWGDLATYLGGASVAGSKLMETGTDHWAGPNSGATNETGFSALPAGRRRYFDGSFSDKGNLLYLWQGQISQSVYFNRVMASNSTGLSRESGSSNLLFSGFSVRCMKNDPGEIPVLNTSAVTNIAITSATCGGNIISGGPVYSKGVCWSTSNLPTVSDKKTIDGTGMDPFVSNLTGLTSSTTYYARAYATTGIGTGYGQVVSFTTKNAEVPVLTTTLVSLISSTTATSGGNITYDGGSPVTSRGVCWSTSPNPTASDARTYEGTGTGSFISYIITLSPSTLYYLKAYATNLAGTGYGEEIQFKTTGDSIIRTGTVNDIDGNGYQTIKIGNQIWMARNLETTKYNDGIPIPNITDKSTWAASTTGAYCDYSNVPANSANYGRLYNWYAVDNNAATKMASNGGRNVCPTGWHVPSDDEWAILATYLGGPMVAGGKLKESGFTHWQSPNTDATNERGFTALPGGYRDYWGYYEIGQTGVWWSSTELSGSEAKFGKKRDMVYRSAIISSNDDDFKFNGHSVRCVKDN
jgi:uncharacterized protein (TIGR02145 family)